MQWQERMEKNITTSMLKGFNGPFSHKVAIRSCGKIKKDCLRVIKNIAKKFNCSFEIGKYYDFSEVIEVTFIMKDDSCLKTSKS